MSPRAERLAALERDWDRINRAKAGRRATAAEALVGGNEQVAAKVRQPFREAVSPSSCLPLTGEGGE